MDPIARIVDANANRAREGLRVMEDAARFALNDEALCGELKRLRHALRAALDRLPIDAAARLANRDVEGDAGRDVKAVDEMARGGLREVAAAAGARVGEALRSLEECAKALAAPESARELERARYAAYALGQRLVLAFGTGRARQWRLCVLITESLCTHHPWPRVAELALAGGADCLQLREKALEGGELVRRAERLIALARPMGASVIVNDRVDVALAAEADGVHLGQGDLSVAQARAMAGERLLIGVSTSNLGEARQAARDGADSCGVGPMFATSTKHKETIVGPAYLREYLSDPATSRLPHLAIGGIGAGNLNELTAVGCRGVAVSSGVCGAPDPAAACRAILAGLSPGFSE